MKQQFVVVTRHGNETPCLGLTDSFVEAIKTQHSCINVVATEQDIAAAEDKLREFGRYCVHNDTTEAYVFVLPERTEL